MTWSRSCLLTRPGPLRAGLRAIPNKCCHQISAQSAGICKLNSRTQWLALSSFPPAHLPQSEKPHCTCWRGVMIRPLTGFNHVLQLQAGPRKSQTASSRVPVPGVLLCRPALGPGHAVPTSSQFRQRGPTELLPQGRGPLAVLPNMVATSQGGLGT